MTDPLTTKEIVNHDEALSLAQYKRENSNLARCYIARTLELDRLTAERNAANICLFHMQEAAKALLAERDRLALDLAAEERGQDNLRREIVALTAERDRQKALLKRLEFAGLREMCPECGGWMVSDAGCTPRAHTATCELAAALKDQP